MVARSRYGVISKNGKTVTVVRFGSVDASGVKRIRGRENAQKIAPKLLITHRFKLDQLLEACDTFSPAAATQALKVVIVA